MDMSNTIIIAIISSILTIILYLINIKLSNETYDNKTLIKIGTLGILVGIFNSILVNITNIKSSLNLNQDILTGTPNF